MANSFHSSDIPYKIYLSEDELPQAWYNVRADMKTKPAPILNPATHRFRSRFSTSTACTARRR